MTLRFSGHVFLHSLDKVVFLTILAKLNVGLFCHPDTAFCSGDLLFADRQNFLLSLTVSNDGASRYHDLNAWPNCRNPTWEFISESCLPEPLSSGKVFDDSWVAHVPVDFVDYPQK